MTDGKKYCYIAPLFLILGASLFLALASAKTIRKSVTFFPPFEGLNTSVSPLILNAKALVTATNVLYDHVGVRKKRGGLLFLSESSLYEESSGSESSGPQTVTGMFDFRKIATTGAETRTLVVNANDKTYKMDELDGSFDDISSEDYAFNSDNLIDYAVLRKANTTTDTLIIVNGEDVPHIWDQDSTTTTRLTGTPTGVDFYPSCIESHKNRLWAAGVPSRPYRVYYSVEGKHDDWNSSGSGYIDIVDSRGNKVTGLAGNYYDFLVTFTEGSIFTISGSSSDDFAASPLIQGVGAINNNSIVPFANDIFFVSNKGIHSLVTTEQYGDIKETYLSAPIQIDFNRSLRASNLHKTVAAVWPQLNYLIFSVPSGGATTNDTAYVYDYIGKRWSTWTGINASSFVIAKNSSGNEELLAGNYDGFVNRLNRSNRNDNSEAYTMRWKTPHLYLTDPPSRDKVFKKLILYLKPQGVSDLTVYYRVGNRDRQTLTFSQAGSGGTLGSFVLGTDSLGGGALIPRSKNLTGTGKSIQLTFEQGDVDIGSEVYGYTVEFTYSQTDYSN